MPHARAEWLAAMKAECAQIPNAHERLHFALGCFKAAGLERARTRRGLNYIARAGGAFCLLVLSLAGLYSATQMRLTPELALASDIISGLCLFYMGCAVLLVASVRRLQGFAALGFSAATLSWLYFGFVKSGGTPLPIEFLTAISFEAAGLMAGLFLFTIYLGWLYSPDTYEA